MVFYNVTVKILDEIKEDWINWMKTVHIPDVMATGHFSDYKFMKILNNENDGSTFAIQYYCKSLTDLDQYNKNHADSLQEIHTTRYKDQFVAFRTIMKEVG